MVGKNVREITVLYLSIAPGLMYLKVSFSSRKIDYIFQRVHFFVILNSTLKFRMKQQDVE